MRTSGRLPRALISLGWLALGAGCGGSSSETPPPLPPHPLHEAYRRPRVVEPQKAPAPSEEPLEESEPPPAAPAAPGVGSQTWGSDAPPPLPETQIK